VARMPDPLRQGEVAGALGIGSALVAVAAVILIAVDTVCVWLGWNHFITVVTDLPTVTFWQALAGCLLKASVTRGFGLRVRRDS
jgi:hypothetical protein